MQKQSGSTQPGSAIYYSAEPKVHKLGVVLVVLTLKERNSKGPLLGPRYVPRYKTSTIKFLVYSSTTGEVLMIKVDQF
jgi:hypothetical protein